jgi:hypothetical protein
MRIFISKELREDSACSGIFGKQIVPVAPHPTLAGFRRNNDRMPRVVEMFGHMPVGGLVAAERGATGLAGTQVYPVVPELYTLLTDIFFCMLQLLDGLHMRTD